MLVDLFQFRVDGSKAFPEQRKPLFLEPINDFLEFCLPLPDSLKLFEPLTVVTVLASELVNYVEVITFHFAKGSLLSSDHRGETVLMEEKTF